MILMLNRILLACLCLRPDLLVDSFPLDQQSIEIPETECSDSCENDVDMDESDSCDNDADDNDDSEEDDEEEEDMVHSTAPGKFLLENDDDTDHERDEAAHALTRMKSSDGSPRDKTLISRSLIAACTDNDVNTVRKLLCEGNSLNEATEDGDSLLSLACSAGYYELAQVLLAMSAQVDDRGQKNDCTPLMEAATTRKINISQQQRKQHKKPNAQTNTKNNTNNHNCASRNEKAPKHRTKHRKNVKHQNKKTHTPRMQAPPTENPPIPKTRRTKATSTNTNTNKRKESAVTPPRQKRQRHTEQQMPKPPPLRLPQLHQWPRRAAALAAKRQRPRRKVCSKAAILVKRKPPRVERRRTMLITLAL
uniref:Putative secreted protein n=1 Tax=Anopheles darlingi TaxID=43151 RepID=A0A2M4DQM6_ANODA